MQILDLRRLGVVHPEVQFPLEWMLKDLELVSKTADECGYFLQTGSKVKGIFAQASHDGFSRKDFSAIYYFLKGQSRRGFQMT